MSLARRAVNEKRITKPMFRKAMRASGVKTIIGIALFMDVKEKTLRQYLLRHPDLKQEYYDYRDNVVMSKAEDVVIDAIEKMDLNTAKWWLGKRNTLFSDKQSIEHSGELQINIKIEDKNNDN